MEEQQTDACQAENDSEARIKGLKWRIRIVLTLALSLIAYGFIYSDLPDLRWARPARWMLLIGLMLLPCVLWLRSQRTELAQQGCSPLSSQSAELAKQDCPSPKKSLVWVVISAILAACLATVPDPMIVFMLGTMSGIALVMARIGRPTAARVRFFHAAIYGVAAIVVYLQVSDEPNKVDLLTGKLEEYKRQHEVYPEQLVDMVPALLPTIPKPGVTGFKYSRRADTNSYSLYYKSSANRTCYYTPETKLKCNID